MEVMFNLCLTECDTSALHGTFLLHVATQGLGGLSRGWLGKAPWAHTHLKKFTGTVNPNKLDLFVLHSMGLQSLNIVGCFHSLLKA